MPEKKDPEDGCLALVEDCISAHIQASHRMRVLQERVRELVRENNLLLRRLEAKEKK